MAAAANTLGVNLDAARAAKGIVSAVVPEPPAPPTQMPAPPNLATAADRVRANREAMDAANRKRGRAASVFTGPEGVAPNATPLGFKTLVGS